MNFYFYSWINLGKPLYGDSSSWAILFITKRIWLKSQIRLNLSLFSKDKLFWVLDDLINWNNINSIVRLSAHIILWDQNYQLFDLVTRNKLYTKMNGTRYWNILSRMHLLVNISSKSSTPRISGFQNRPLNLGFEKLILNKSLKRDLSELRTTLS